MARYIGIDLGGTNIKAGLTDEQGSVVCRQSVPTRAEEGPDAVIEAMADAARAVAADGGMALDDVAGIGVGAPGPLDRAAGVIRAAPNLPGWTDIPLRDRLGEVTGRPVTLENDANAAAYGEFWAGAGRDPAIRHMVMFTLGTGIGAGLIVDGELVVGGFGLGAEAGHMIVHPGGRPCGCGQAGCLEMYAAASRLPERVAAAISAGERSCAAESAGAAAKLGAEDVFAAARRADAVASRVVAEAVEALAIASVNMCRLLDPQMIVFAGGMIAAGKALFDPVRTAFAGYYWSLTEPTVKIVPATLGNDAGFVGAAGVAAAAAGDG